MQEFGDSSQERRPQRLHFTYLLPASVSDLESIDVLLTLVSCRQNRILYLTMSCHHQTQPSIFGLHCTWSFFPRQKKSLRSACIPRFYSGQYMGGHWSQATTTTTTTTLSKYGVMLCHLVNSIVTLYREDGWIFSPAENPTNTAAAAAAAAGRHVTFLKASKREVKAHHMDIVT